MAKLGAVVFLDREGSSLLLEDVLFDPAARWLSCALARAGVEKFLVVCRAGELEAARACFPESTQFACDDVPGCLSRFLGETDRVAVISQPVFLDEHGARVLCGLAGALPQGEDRGVYMVDSDALRSDWETEGDFLALAGKKGAVFGVKPGCFEGLLPLERTGGSWDSAQYFARHASIDRLQAGMSWRPVRFLDKEQVYIGPQAEVGEGTVILPGTILKGKTVIGRDCVIGPHTMIADCSIGDRVTVNASQLNESTVDDDTTVGPFAYVRPNCRVGKKVKVGDFVELKNSTIGDGTKISHLTYVGDTDAGAGINFGCGTVTVNYDGAKKFRTTIGDHAFIGCNTNLVAPVTVGEGAYTAAGSTITEDVPADALAIARQRQTVKDGWAAKRPRKK